MKKIVLFSCLLLSLLSFGNISLDIDFKHNRKGEQIKLVKSINTSLNKINTVKVPNSDKLMEVIVSEVMPEDFPKIKSKENLVLVDMKLYKLDGENKRILSSPSVIIEYGKEGSMETFDTIKNNGKPVMSLKVIPRQSKKLILLRSHHKLYEY